MFLECTDLSPHSTRSAIRRLLDLAVLVGQPFLSFRPRRSAMWIIMNPRVAFDTQTLQIKYKLTAFTN